MPILLGLLLICSPSFAGLVVQGKITQMGSEGPLRQYYQGGNARLDFHSSPSAETGLIYRTALGKVVLIDHKKKSFLEATLVDIERVATILGAFKGRKEVTAPVAHLTWAKQDKKRKVGKWNCTSYQLLDRKKKRGSLCVVPMAEVGATEADFQPIVSIAKSLKTMGVVPPQETGFLDMIDRALKLGFMVEFEGFNDSGSPLTKVVIESTKTETLPESTFGNPVAYAQNDLTSLLKR